MSTRFLPTVVLAALAGIGTLVAPRLSTPPPVAEVEEISPAAPAGPCFRWGALQCCYVEDKAFDWESPSTCAD
jgi:hypothetical protein